MFDKTFNLSIDPKDNMENLGKKCFNLFRFSAVFLGEMNSKPSNDRAIDNFSVPMPNVDPDFTFRSFVFNSLTLFDTLLGVIPYAENVADKVKDGMTSQEIGEMWPNFDSVHLCHVQHLSWVCLVLTGMNEKYSPFSGVIGVTLNVANVFTSSIASTLNLIFMDYSGDIAKDFLAAGKEVGGLLLTYLNICKSLGLSAMALAPVQQQWSDMRNALATPPTTAVCPSIIVGLKVYSDVVMVANISVAASSI